MPVAVTVFVFPTFLSAKVAIPLTVNRSPEMRVSPNVTAAVSVPS